MRAHSRHQAEVDHIVVTLRTYGGVLPRQRLANLCGAAHWSDAGFRLALADAVSSGQVRPLGAELYEVTGYDPQT
jgi:hypothetical protein